MTTAPPPPPPAAPAPLPARAPGPTVALPRPPGPLGTATAEFWSARTGPVPSWVLAATAGVGVVGAAAVVGQPAGAGLAAVGVLVWAGALPALVRRRSVADLAAVALAMALAVMIALRAAEWVTVLCVLAAAGLGAVVATSGRSAPAVLLAPLGAVAGLVRSLAWLRGGVSGRLGARREGFMVAVRTAAVTVALLAVFGVLFATADPVFAAYLPRLEADLLPGQVVVGILIAATTATLAHLAVAPPGWGDLTLPAARPARLGAWLTPVVALDLLVLAFVLVQVGALVDGHAHVLETVGLSYAEYARAGFGQLVAATALTLLVVAVAVRHAPRSTSTERTVTRVALAVLCVGTLGVVASALRRMDLYVEAFGLTRLRLVVVAGEVALGVVLVLVLVAGVARHGRWVPRAVAYVAALTVLGIAVVNPDAMIARHNTTADLLQGPDLGYLAGLSADAVPALVGLDEPERSCVLGGRAVEAPTSLGGWNLGRAQARAALVGVDVDHPGPQCWSDVY